MHVESARGKQSQRPRKARFHKLVKFIRRVEMGLGSLVVMQPLSVCLEIGKLRRSMCSEREG